MLYLIGLGLKPGHITNEALEAAASCRALYLDSYTSRYAEGSVGELEKAAGRKITAFGRKEIEEGFGRQLKEAKNSDIALLVFGNPLSATTHVQMLLDAKKAGVETRVIPGISIFDMLASTGLDQYKFGRICTIVYPQKGYAPESFYGIIEKNFRMGWHTLCLLDIRAEEGRLMSISEAIEILEGIEKNRKTEVLKKTRLVGIAGAGGKKQQAVSGSAEKIRAFSFSEFPQSLIVCGTLNEKEKEALKVLSNG